MKPVFIAAALAAATCLQGCATPPAKPVFVAPSGLAPQQSVIYIYRPGTPALATLAAEFRVEGGATVARIEDNGCAAITLAPGSHTLSQTWSAGRQGDSRLEGRPIRATVDTSPGAVTYVRFSASADVSVAENVKKTDVAWKMTPVDAAQALPEAARCSRLGTVDTAGR